MAIKNRDNIYVRVLTEHQSFRIPVSALNNNALSELLLIERQHIFYFGS